MRLGPVDAARIHLGETPPEILHAVRVEARAHHVVEPDIVGLALERAGVARGETRQDEVADRLADMAHRVVREFVAHDQGQLVIAFDEVQHARREGDVPPVGIGVDRAAGTQAHARGAHRFRAEADRARALTPLHAQRHGAARLLVQPAPQSGCIGGLSVDVDAVAGLQHAVGRPARRDLEDGRHLARAQFAPRADAQLLGIAVLGMNHQAEVWPRLWAQIGIGQQHGPRHAQQALRLPVLRAQSAAFLRDGLLPQGGATDLR